MAWEDIFPVLDEALICEYEDSASLSEKARIRDYFQIEDAIVQGRFERVASTSLFFGPKSGVSVDGIDLSEKVLKSAFRAGFGNGCNPWEHYVVPLIAGARRFRRNRVDSGFRVYLANNLLWGQSQITDIYN